MSDDGFMMEDDEEFEFEYEEDDGDEAEGVVDVENDYYTAKCPSSPHSPFPLVPRVQLTPMSCSSST